MQLVCKLIHVIKTRVVICFQIALLYYQNWLQLSKANHSENLVKSVSCMQKAPVIKSMALDSVYYSFSFGHSVHQCRLTHKSGQIKKEKAAWPT